MLGPRDIITQLRRTLGVRTNVRKITRKLRPPKIGVDDLLPEISDFTPLRSGFSKLRLNLVVYSVNLSDRFGGIQSSLDFLEELGRFLPNLRILVTAGKPDPEALKSLTSFKLLASSEDAPDIRQIQFLGDRPDRSFFVGCNDIFITHGWWEAYRAERWTSWQCATYSCPQRPLVFMIQEFEPGFYAYSARFALAEQAFKTKAPHIAVINTALLAEHYRLQGFRFQRVFSFEPRMNSKLLTNLEAVRSTKKEKILFCYCRPFAERNAFELVALSLREWARNFPSAGDWQIVSAGALHDPFELKPGMVVEAKGKLTLQEYSSLLSRSAVGVSLMISPHPSYPPLEFAHYGLRVLTNRFGIKDITGYHDNIYSVDDLHPENIARELGKLCAAAESNLEEGWKGISHLPQYLSPENPFHFSREIAKELQRWTENGPCESESNG